MADPSLLPTVLIRKGKEFQVQASKKIDVGTCVARIVFRKPYSMVMEGEQNGVRTRNGVYCNVDWTRRSVSKVDVEKSRDESEEVSVKVSISPNPKLPKGDINESLDWTKTEELHPFWFIKRAKPLHDIPNMELIYCPASHILASGFEALVKAEVKVKPVTEVVVIAYPCLVNTVVIEPGSELILKCEQISVTGPAKAPRERNAFGQLKEAESKAKKASME